MGSPFAATEKNTGTRRFAWGGRVGGCRIPRRWSMDSAGLVPAVINSF